MTVETITEHDQPGSEPGNPSPQPQADAGLAAQATAALVILDAFPLNWAAQAFGLNSAGTWLVTCSTCGLSARLRWRVSTTPSGRQRSLQPSMLSS